MTTAIQTIDKTNAQAKANSAKRIDNSKRKAARIEKETKNKPVVSPAAFVLNQWLAAESEHKSLLPANHKVSRIVNLINAADNFTFGGKLIDRSVAFVIESFAIEIDCKDKSAEITKLTSYLLSLGYWAANTKALPVSVPGFYGKASSWFFDKSADMFRKEEKNGTVHAVPGKFVRLANGVYKRLFVESAPKAKTSKRFTTEQIKAICEAINNSKATDDEKIALLTMIESGKDC